MGYGVPLATIIEVDKTLPVNFLPYLLVLQIQLDLLRVIFCHFDVGLWHDSCALFNKKKYN